MLILLASSPFNVLVTKMIHTYMIHISLHLLFLKPSLLIPHPLPFWQLGFFGLRDSDTLPFFVITNRLRRLRLHLTEDFVVLSVFVPGSPYSG